MIGDKWVIWVRIIRTVVQVFRRTKQQLRQVSVVSTVCNEIIEMNIQYSEKLCGVKVVVLVLLEFSTTPVMYTRTRSMLGSNKSGYRAKRITVIATSLPHSSAEC